MKSRNFGASLEALADLMADAGASDRADLWRRLARLMHAAGDRPVALTLSALADAKGAKARAQEAAVSIVLKNAPRIKRFIAAVGKPAAEADFQSLVEWLEPRQAQAIDRLIAASVKIIEQLETTAQTDLVQDYTGKLQAALGDEDAFTAVLDELESDRRFRVAEVRAISKRVTRAGGRSKRDALERIRQRHASVARGAQRRSAVA